VNYNNLNDLKIGGFYIFNSNANRCIYKFDEEETAQIIDILSNSVKMIDILNPLDKIVLLQIGIGARGGYFFKVLTSNGIVGWINTHPKVFINAITSR